MFLHQASHRLQSGLAASCSPRCAGARPNPLARQSRLLRSALPPAPGDGGSDSDAEGNKQVQDVLADLMQMEIRKQTIKQEILKDLDARKETLRQIGDQLTEEMGKEIELDKQRAELASTMSLSETLDKFKQLEDEVDAVRAQLTADKAELAQWEQDTAAARSQGLFFKSLYQTEKGKPVGTPSDKEAVQKLTDGIKEPARAEVYSPLRLYIFTYMTIVLAYVVGEDLAQNVKPPSVGLDVLYSVLCVGLGYNAWAERAALQAAQEKMHEGDGEGPGGGSKQ